MKPHIVIGKLIAVLVMALIFAGAVRFDEARRGKMGREEFLAQQAKRFDKHFAQQGSFVVTVIAAGFLTTVMFAVYELLALGAGAMVGKMGQPDQPATIPPGVSG
jgi:predicted RND superfamily exporter protein